MDLVDVEKALEGLRTGLKQDGADLIVKNINNDCVELTLFMSDATCKECIVSKEILLAKIKIVLGKIFPKVPRIILNDPRSPSSLSHEKI